MACRYIISTILLLVTATAFADEPKDTVRASLPTLSSRLSVNAELSARTGGDYHITKDDATVEQGSAGSFTKASLRASYAVYAKGTTRINTSLRYNHLHQHFNSNSQTLDYGFFTAAHHQFAGSVMGMGRMQLWHRPLVLMGMATCDFSQYGYERWSLMGTAVLMLKQTRQTQFGVGLLGMVNTFSRIPVFAIVTYRHTFSPQWTLNLTLPRFQMEYRPVRSDQLSIGASIDADSYYLHTTSANLPKDVRYSRTNINMGPAYEHRFRGGFILSAEAGVQVVMTNRIYRHNSSHVLATMHEKAAPNYHIVLAQRF